MRVATPFLLLAAALLLTVPTRAHAVCCTLPDNGSGTADTPPNCPNGYTGHLEIVDGFAAGNSIQIQGALKNFTGLVQTPGGPLGGQVETWTADLECQMTGTGAYSAYARTLTLPIINGQSHSAPRVLFAPSQSFNTDLYTLYGLILGDPDFDLLRITAGTAYGMPSPGHTTLTQSGPNWAVDSFFDITYRIDFVGRPSGPFAGYSGTTTRTWRFRVCPEDPTPARHSTWGTLKRLYR